MASAARPTRAARPRLEDLIDDISIEPTVDESDCEEQDVIERDSEEDSDQEREGLHQEESRVGLHPAVQRSLSADVTYQGKDKTTWHASPLPRGTPGRRQGRAPRHQIIREVGGPKQPAATTGSIPETFASFLTGNMMQEIVNMTNKYAHEWIRENESEWYQRRYTDVDIEEMNAFFGCLLLAGVYKSHGESYEQLWSEDQGRAIFGSTMSLRRFQTIMKFLRFDDRDTRERRRFDDKLAPFRNIWDMFVNQCRDNFTVGPNATVDEQLVSFRGRCPFKVFMPSKPDKYGIKVWVLCDTNTAYAYNLEVYLGKTGEFPEVGQASRVVKSLSTRLSGQNITVDNFFTSYELAQSLLQRNITLLGTMRSNKPQIPPEFLKGNRREPLTTLFGYRQDATLCSYVPKKNKAVILLSTMHKTGEVSDRDDKKPLIVLDYNSTKGAVDTLDMCVHTYTCARQTRRWPVRLFYNVLDIAAWNSYVCWITCNPTWNSGKNSKRRMFLIELGNALSKPHILRRYKNPKMQLSVKNRIKSVGLAKDTDLQQVEDQQSSEQQSKGRCHLCDVRKESRTRCSGCSQFTCPEHKKIICNQCVLKLI